MMKLLVSDRGEIWAMTGVTPGPLPPIMAPMADPTEAARSGVRHYASFTHRPEGARIALPSARLSAACFERLVWLLLHFDLERVVIESGRGRVPELYGTQQDAIARLDELRFDGPDAPPRPTFFWERLSIDRLDHPRRSAWRAAVSAWRRNRGRLGAAVLKREVGRIDAASNLLQVGANDQLAIAAIGIRNFLYQPCERLDLIGRDLSQQPDPAYGDFLVEALKLAAEGDRPCLELVEAVVNEPLGGVSRVRYERLVLPWTDRGGGRWLSTEPMLRAHRPLEIGGG